MPTIGLRAHLPTAFRPSVVSFARRHTLKLQVAVGLVLSLAFLVIASEFFFTRAASRELIQQNARAYAADGRAVEQAFLEGDDLDDAIDDALDLVDSMEDRFGVVSASLLDADRDVVVAPRDANLAGANRSQSPDEHAGPKVEDVEVDEVGRGFQFVVPVRLGDKQFFLRVQEDGEALQGRIGALSSEATIFSGVAVLLAFALFYVVGGRTLARRHAVVSQRAARDPLTNLGNHRSFQDELERAVAIAARKLEPLALAVVDLDKFKAINDRYGHRQGDDVLRDVARVLDSGRGDDRAFRIGGDEFALILPEADAVEASSAIERRLTAARATAAGSTFTAGIAMLRPGDLTNPAVLWEQADAALYEGKRSGGDSVVAFDDVSDLLSIVTPAKTRALQALLDEPRVEIAFQPIWDLDDGRVFGLEALARPWEGYGFEGPAEMFAVAEKLGRAHRVDNVCRLAALARARELPDDVLLFLNVNPQTLVHGTLDDRFLRAVADAGLDPARVVLEITERSGARLSLVTEEAVRLHDLGFRLALDDVGAGNAGLDMLRHLPVDFVKIDHSVIAAAMDENHAHAILLAIVAYARKANAYVIAEGIETPQMLAFVRKVDEARDREALPIRGGQGYLLGRPSAEMEQALTVLPVAVPPEGPTNGAHRYRRSPAGLAPSRAQASRERMFVEL